MCAPPAEQRGEDQQVDDVAADADGAELGELNPVCPPPERGRRARGDGHWREASGRRRASASPAAAPVKLRTPVTSGTNRHRRERLDAPPAVLVRDAHELPAERQDEPAAGRELVEQRRRQLGGRGRDRDRVERRLLAARRASRRRAAPRPSPCPVAARLPRATVGELGDPLDGDDPAARARRAPRPGSRSRFRRRARARRPRSASAWQMSATTYGCEIVWPWPSASAASS